MKTYEEMAGTIEFVGALYVSRVGQLPVKAQIPVICATIDMLAEKSGLDVAEFMDFMAEFVRVLKENEENE